MTTLVSDVSAAEVAWRIAGDVSAAVEGGLYSIDDELVILDRFGQVTASPTYPWGIDHAAWRVQRGARSTAAVPHAAGAAIYAARVSYARGDTLAAPSPIATTGTAAAMSQAFPVGSLFLSAVATSPATLLGYGTWLQVAQGMMLAGQLANDPSFGAAGNLAGSWSHGHSVTQPDAHAALTHTGAAVGDHSTVSHTAHTGAAVADHVVTQPSAHSNHVVTQPGAHSNHAFTQPGAHSDHAVTQASAHSAHAFTQPSAHSAHVVTQPSAHADNIAHTHGLNVQGGTTAATTGTHLMTSTATGGSARAITTGDAGLSQGTGSSLAHSGAAVDAHSAHAGGAVDAHSAHAGAAVDSHSAHAGGAVDAHSAHSGAAVDAHSAHAGAAVSAHGVTQADAHSDHTLSVHSVTQPGQHGAQSHTGAAVASTAVTPPAFVAYIWQRTA